MNTLDFARGIRCLAVKMVAAANASHIGGALSMADILAVLYGDILDVRPADPFWPDRDRVILSKGHCCTAMYAALAIRGFFPEAELAEYGKDGSRLMAHVSHGVPGVELSTGSLGHGLPVAAGRALAGKRRGREWRVFAVLSDGELDEGSNWEAFLFAPQHGLDNLTVIIDYNKIQSLGRVDDVIALEPLAAKLTAFRWSVRETDGHDHDALKRSLRGVPWETGRPSCLIAHTVKGKGVGFMEDSLEWHYRPPRGDLYEEALRQLEES
ncbi:transketolase [bacterium]|nr:transketolase [bacterium]